MSFVGSDSSVSRYLFRFCSNSVLHCITVICLLSSARFPPLKYFMEIFLSEWSYWHWVALVISSSSRLACPGLSTLCLYECRFFTLSGMFVLVLSIQFCSVLCWRSWCLIAGERGGMAVYFARYSVVVVVALTVALIIKVGAVGEASEAGWLSILPVILWLWWLRLRLR